MEYKNILDMPREERIDLIEDSIRKDPYYTEQTGSYREIAIKGNEVAEKFFHINKNNPIYIKGDKVYFEPDSRSIKRDGYLVAQAKYAAHFPTVKGEGKRFYAAHKFNAIYTLEKILKDPKERFLQRRINDENKIVYVTEIEVENYSCMILKIVIEKEGNLEIITTYPNKEYSYVQKKKASGEWSDAPFSNPTEQPPVGKAISGCSGGTDVPRTQDKDTNNNNTNNKKKMGGNIDNLIEIVEKHGKIRWKYETEETYWQPGSGSAVLYDYNGKAYEIITWNDDAKFHTPGEKTISVVNELEPQNYAKKGKKIEDEYEKLSPRDKELHIASMENTDYPIKKADIVWDSWMPDQRKHFLEDHTPDYTNPSIVGSEYVDLPSFIKDKLRRHIDRGRYAKGGLLESREEYRNVRYEIFYEAPNGYYVVPVDLESTIIFSFKQPYFDKLEDAKEYAEIEINGYLREEEKENTKVEFKEGGKTQFLKACTVGTEIQEIILDKKYFPTLRSAKTWAWRHKMKHGNVKEKEKYFHLKQEEESKYRKDSFRTINLSNDESVRAIIGCPKSSVKSKLKK